MSINQVRHILEKPGCAIGCSIVMGAAVIIGLFQAGTCNNPNQQNQAAGASQPIVKVADRDVTFAELSTAEGSGMDRTVSPDIQARQEGAILQQLVDEATTLSFAEQQGINMTPELAKEAAPTIISRLLQSERERLVSLGKLKPGATDKEFSDALFKDQQQTPEQARASIMQRIQEQLADPNTAERVMAAIARDLLLEKYKGQVALTDDTLQHSFDNLRVKSILINKPEAEASKEIQEALAAIKGGMTFEQAMDKYSTEPAPPKKKKSDNEMTLPRTYFEAMPDLKPITNLKPGEISQPIKMGTGYVIYKLIEAKPALPKDFAGNKEIYRNSVATSMAGSQLQKDLEAYTASTKPEWVSDGYRLLYEVSKTLTHSEGQTPEQEAQKLRQLSDEASKVTSATDIAGHQAAVMANLLAATELYQKNSQDKANIERRIAAIKQYLVSFESAELRKELAFNLADTGHSREAAEHLVLAARANSPLDPMGQRINEDITGLLERLQKEKAITPEQVKAVESDLDRWKKGKREIDKRQEEARKQQEQFEKAAREAQEKAKNKAPDKAAPKTK